jgi:hypothetical protein
MKQVSIDELKQIAAAARESIWQQAKSKGREPRIYLHWSAGHYDTVFDDYHINITGTGKIYITGDLDEVKAHTWQMNTGAVAISLCCAYGATTNDLGPEPPTSAQIEAMAQAIAAVADGLWLTIDKAHVRTHGEQAANECGWEQPAYAPWNDECHDGQVRWDLEYLRTEESPRYNPQATDGSRGGDVLRGKANYYRQAWKK